MKKRLLGLIVSCLVLGLSSLWAKERGSIRGLVKSKDGRVIESATVKVVGQRLAAGQEFITGKDGSFLFQALPPGMYTLTATPPQMLDFGVDVIVALDKQTFVNV